MANRNCLASAVEDLRFELLALSTCSAALATPLFMRHSQNFFFYVLLCDSRNTVFGGTRHTTPPFMCCYAALATLCSAALATQPSPFDVLLCGTRNTVFGGTRHTTPTLLIHVLLSGTRGTVLGGTRHTTYSCVVKRYSRHCVRRHSPHYSFMCC